MNKLGIDFNDIGQVSYTEKDIADLKQISTKIKTSAQSKVQPFTGSADSLNLPPDDKDLSDIPPSEEKVKKIDEYINPDNNEEVIGVNDNNLFDNYHNFYINFFKYLKYFLGTNLTKGRQARSGEIEFIKKFSFNYGSQIMASFDYYNGASFELPFANINLVDVHPMDNVQYISRQCMGKTPANNIIIAENKDLDEVVFTSVQYNYINISVEITFESTAELLDYISNVNNHIPLNYTIYLPKYYNYINISEVTKTWKKEHTYYGLVVMPNNTFNNKLYTYGKLEFEPTTELNNISQSVSKEDNTNTLSLDFIFGMAIPTNVYKKTKRSIRKITTDINVQLNDSIINKLPLLNTLTAESFIDIEKTDQLKLGQKSASIKETIVLNSENLLLNAPYKILTFNSEINFMIFSKNNFDGIGFWRKKILNDDLIKDSGNIEKFIPINYLFNEKTVESILYRFDSTITKEKNMDILFNGGGTDIYGKPWLGIYSFYPRIYDKLNHNKVFRFIILSENNKDDIETITKNLNSETFPEGTMFHYLIKSKYILAEAEEINNPKDYYNSILLYN